MGRQEDLFSKAEPWSLYQNPKVPELPLPPLDAPARELALHAALAKAKEHLCELRARLVRADSVAFIWATVPCHPDSGNAREAEVRCGELIRSILSVDGDLSLRTALQELARQRVVG